MYSRHEYSQPYFPCILHLRIQEYLKNKTTPVLKIPIYLIVIPLIRQPDSYLYCSCIASAVISNLDMI